MLTARDVMASPAPTVDPHMTIKDLSHHLLDEHLDGVCVVRDGKLEGVVTSMDLIFKEKKVHLPTFFFFLDAVVPTGDPRRTYDEVLKIAGTRVEDILSLDPVTVTPETPLPEVAELMVDQHLTVLPVVDGDTLVGMVTKTKVLAAAFR